MTPAAAAASSHHTAPNPTPHGISQKKTQDTRRKNFLHHARIPIQERICDFIKIIFRFHVKGGTQERICDFIKIFFQWGRHCNLIKIIFHFHINGKKQERKINFIKNFCIYCTLIHVCILNIITLIRAYYFLLYSYKT